jgi:hypothetical protein
MQSTSLLRQQHEKLGNTIDAAEKANPFVAMTLAKRAARDSHKLLEGLIVYVENLEQRLIKLDAVNDGE